MRKTRYHYELAYEDKVFTFFLVPMLLLGLIFSEATRYVQAHRPVAVPKPYARKVTEVIIHETPPLPPQQVEAAKETRVAAIPARPLTQAEKKRLTSPPPLSAVGSPKALYSSSRYAAQPGDVKKMVARKGLLGLLSQEAGDTDLRAYHPSKKRDVSKEMAAALKNLSGVPAAKAQDEDDFLGVGNLPAVAKKGSDLGYILNASKIGEVRETQVEFYGGTEGLPERRATKELAAKTLADLPKEKEEDVQEMQVGTGGRAASEIRKIVASYLGGLRYLYNKALRQQPTLKGKITVQFEISPSGVVTSASLISTTVGYAPLEQAVLDNIRRWKFPAIAESNGSVKVTYPFVFLPPAS